MGFLGDEPVACISVVAYGDAYGFLGFYICHPDHRGRATAAPCGRPGSPRLGERTIGLDGVVAQQANYAKSGFALAHRNVRYGGTASAHETADVRLVELRNDHPTGLAGSIVAYDRVLQPGPRETFLRTWLTPPGRRTLAFVENDAICGYGCVRECRRATRSGRSSPTRPRSPNAFSPPSPARLHGAPVFLDVPEPNAEAVALAERHGLAPVFETARMYRGHAPVEQLDRTFGITTFELG